MVLLFIALLWRATVFRRRDRMSSKYEGIELVDRCIC